MTTYYNITKSPITKKYRLHTWFAHSGGVIDEGANIYPSIAAVNKALALYENAKPLTEALLRELGIGVSLRQYH
jgi:hypothetical protein